MGSSDLGQLLVRTHSALAQAQDETAVLQAIGESLQVFSPVHVGLSNVHTGADGSPSEVELVRAWRDGVVLREHPFYGVRFPVSDNALAEQCLAINGEPAVFADVAGTALAGAMPEMPWKVGSIVLLPLYSKRHGRWQGLIDVHYPEPRQPSDDELLVYRLLIHTVAESLASERTLQTLRDALAESRAQQTTLKLLLDNLPIGITVTRATSGEREIVNHAAQVLFGAGSERRPIVDNRERLFLPGAERPLPFEDWPYSHTLRSGEPARAELEFLRDDGERVLVELSTHGLRYDDGELRVVGLFRDLSEVRRAEREKLHAQDELLRVQALALAERSTPLIPIREDVLVMPLIGAIDEERGRRLLETLVHLGGRARVRAAIIDVTGVKEVDASAAAALVGAARALLLRGVRPIVTGIQHSAASALVELGVDFTGIAVRATLQDGVELATAGFASR